MAKEHLQRCGVCFGVGDCIDCDEVGMDCERCQSTFQCASCAGDGSVVAAAHNASPSNAWTLLPWRRADLFRIRLSPLPAPLDTVLSWIDEFEAPLTPGPHPLAESIKAQTAHLTAGSYVLSSIGHSAYDNNTWSATSGKPCFSLFFPTPAETTTPQRLRIAELNLVRFSRDGWAVFEVIAVHTLKDLWKRMESLPAVSGAEWVALHLQGSTAPALKQINDGSIALLFQQGESLEVLMAFEQRQGHWYQLLYWGKLGSEDTGGLGAQALRPSDVEMLELARMSHQGT